MFQSRNSQAKAYFPHLNALNQVYKDGRTSLSARPILRIKSKKSQSQGGVVRERLLLGGNRIQIPN